MYGIYGVIDGVTWYTEIIWSRDNAQVFGLEKRGDF